MPASLAVPRTSGHHQFLFPRDMHRPPPDRRALETQLLKGGYVLKPRGMDVPCRTLINLNFGLASPHESSYQDDQHMHMLGGVIARYARAGYLLPSIPIRHNDTMEQTEALLLATASRRAICMLATQAAIGIVRDTAWGRRPGGISVPACAPTIARIPEASS